MKLLISRIGLALASALLLSAATASTPASPAHGALVLPGAAPGGTLTLPARVRSVPGPTRASVTALPSPLARSSATSMSVSQPRPRWEWPAGSLDAVSRQFVAPLTTYAAGHRGIDIDVAERSQIGAVADGTVFFAGEVAGVPVVSIAHAGGWRSTYQPVAAAVEQGEVVEQGQAVGSKTGAHAGCVSCIHLGAILKESYVSPMILLDSLEHSVLLPVW